MPSALQPDSVAHFRCLGSDCTDTCCQGWDVVIDRATHDRYRALPACRLKSELDRSVVPNSRSTGDADYARIEMHAERTCPFLTSTRLCAIQEELGESHLSTTCAVYPRARNLVDGALELSLFLSCPEAARLTLLNPEPMRFERVEAEAPHGQIPTLDSEDERSTAKPYRYLGMVRQFVLSLLQNRDCPLQQRLLLLGSFCERIGQIPADRYDCDIPAGVETYRSLIQDGRTCGEIDGYVSDVGAQAQVVTLLLDHLFNTGVSNRRFVECYEGFNEGLNRRSDTTPEQAAVCWRQAYSRHYQPFMVEHEYILENYLVNEAFRTLFPFGPQQSVSGEQRPIFSEYLLLVTQFTLIRGLLIGMAGHHREAFNADLCVQAIQSYSKVAAHNLPFLKTALQFIEACRMHTMQGAATLILS